MIRVGMGLVTRVAARHAASKPSYSEFQAFLGRVFSKLSGKESYSAKEVMAQAQKQPDYKKFKRAYQSFLAKAAKDPSSELYRVKYNYRWGPAKDHLASEPQHSTDRVAGGGESLEKFLDKISFKAYHAIKTVDQKFVGTPDYMGFGFFWNTDYKFSMRDAPADKRRAVHKAFLKARLPVDEASPKHEAIVKRIVGL